MFPARRIVQVGQPLAWEPWRGRVRADETGDLGHRAERSEPVARNRLMQQVRHSVQPITRFAQRVWRSGHLGNSRAGRQRARQLVQKCPLVGGARVDLEAEIPESHLAQAVMHDRERGHLLCHEEDPFSVMGSSGDDVRDRLGLARAGRSLHDDIATGAHLFDHAGLRGVRGDHVQKVTGFQPRVEPFLWAEEGRGPLEPAVE